jgi:hypothetical protein
MTKTWINIGDVNPREHGGLFVCQTDTSVTVIETNNLDECGRLGEYRIFEKEIDIEEIDRLWENFCSGEKSDVGFFADWDTLRELPKNMRRFRIVADMLSYYGPDSYPFVTRNYWKALRPFGIYPRHS